MLKISIPKPCYEDWDAMEPVTKGRHCNVCAKTVTDFTTMTDEEIKHFFINKKQEQVCGRFCTEQLKRITIDIPGNILYVQMPLWKKFLVACLIIFSASLFSCNINIQADTAITQQLRAINNQLLYSSIPNNGYVGGIVFTIDSTFGSCSDYSNTETPLLKGMPLATISPNLSLYNPIFVTNTIDTLPIIDINEQKAKPGSGTDSIDCNKQTFY